MKPSQLAQSLKRIASQIEASKKPNKELVIRDLKKILSSFSSKPSNITYSEELEEFVYEKDHEELKRVADLFCSATKADSDSEGDVFLVWDGVNLATKAGGKPITQADNDHIAYFFIGTEQEVIAKVSALPDKSVRELLES